MRWLGEGSRRPRDGEQHRSGWIDEAISWARDQTMMWYRCNMVIWPRSALILAPYFWSGLSDARSSSRDRYVLSCRNCDPSSHDDNVREASLYSWLGCILYLLNVITQAVTREALCVWYMIGCDDGVIKTRQRMRRAHPTSPSQPTINIQMILDRGWWKIQTSTHTRSPLNCGVIPIKHTFTTCDKL